MISHLKDYFNASDREFISFAHKQQEELYGVLSPPTLKQLISLKHLLSSTGNYRDLRPEDLLGLSKVQCKLLLQKLFKKYRSQHLEE